MSEEVVCSNCVGEKGWGNYPPMNTGDWTECRTCFGTGKLKIYTLEEVREMYEAKENIIKFIAIKEARLMEMRENKYPTEMVTKILKADYPNEWEKLLETIKTF